ncbi:hypothetical protein N7489_006058 [Penicillium chrysogenum]|uniref:Uncharacterized protein n=1 Tax=Penicillium chrysogenum TaxID=5076 RepID=A0ABQ8W2G7_PENCH|nr:uncharacterized protein N7489_006058 [Penicillium chrysogenum]KAJ5235967.1 hypothetical protein N7489_006058 [Penicillium chrysogenum]KAJ5254875.1 hypothetical protein N7505_010026 [Penicillium chrysogenum]KAJ5275905.1 hypothetical protein N7524_002058 [Penicillium chrysogenum]KAJ6153332.1 hypothetical protein N7497_007651 [Penicillium chrysogenum]
MVPLLNPLQSRLPIAHTTGFCTQLRKGSWKGINQCHPPELGGANLGNMFGSASLASSMVQVESVLCLISDFSHILSLSLYLSLSIFISSHLSKKGQVPAFPGLLLHSFSHHTATSFPAQRPLGNDLLKLERCLFILWSPLTSNAELQPSPIYQPPRPPAALTL